MRSAEWTKASEGYFLQEVRRLQVYLQQRQEDETATLEHPPLEEMNEPFVALAQLAITFNLEPFERSLLLFCAAWSITSYIQQQCEEIVQRPLLSPTRDLALFLFDCGHSNFDPSSPLFHWHLIHEGSGDLRNCPLSIDRWVLNYILGFNAPTSLTPSQLPKAFPYSDGDILASSQSTLLYQLLKLWEESSASATLITQLISDDTHASKLIAATAFYKSDYQPFQLSTNNLTFEPKFIEDWMTHWHRLASLENYALILDCGDPSTLNPTARQLIAQLIETTTTPLLITATERIPNTINILTLELSPLSATDQKELWAYHLEQISEPLETQIGALVVQFNLTAHQIQSVAAQALALVKAQDPALSLETLTPTLWKVCQTQSRSSLEGLVERIEPKTTWNELILPPEPNQILHQIIATIRQRAKVYEEWKMGGESRRGMGITSLFYGPSGTGKTTAAEIIAHDLNLDLYRVDLSQVSSKYIGETEKNLKKVFAAAESSGAVLLFDEADSIIGKRSEVKDARDRYANQEVGYLLQAMENYSGLAILTTNLPNSLDTAFMRRIRFSIRFEFPTAEERAQIWQRNFPGTVPTLNLSYQRLAQLNVSGASIRNIAMGGAFVAAQDEQPIQMRHILQAARAEMQKVGRAITDQEIRGWG
jgi:ATPase family associated with various cellular activities (AAA)